MHLNDYYQYTKTNDKGDEILAEILITQALGKDASILWEQYFETEVS